MQGLNENTKKMPIDYKNNETFYDSRNKMITDIIEGK